MFNIAALKPTLLVIDDTPENLTLIYQLLKEDYTVKGANNGKKGLALAKQDQPDLILLDIMMPDVDGHRVLAQLREEHADGLPVPVVVVTGSTVGAERARAELGPERVVEKPFDPLALLAIVRDVTGG